MVLGKGFESFAETSRVDVEIIVLDEINQTREAKYHGLSYMRNPNYKLFEEQNKGETVGNREIDFLQMEKGICGGWGGRRVGGKGDQK